MPQTLLSLLARETGDIRRDLLIALLISAAANTGILVIINQASASAAQGVGDLRLLAMSATLDGARFAALMGGAPVIESEGRSHPLELRHIGRTHERVEDAVASTVRQALAEADGGNEAAEAQVAQRLLRGWRHRAHGRSA